MKNSKITEDINSIKEKILEISFFTACAGTISVAETLIPKPLPFLKIGLANIVILILIMNKKNLTALIVILGKTLLSGLIIGTLLMPTTIIALVSGLLSFSVMILLRDNRLGLSWIGVSVLSAVVHNMSQLVVVRGVLIYSNSIFKLTPLMIILGVVSGILTGVLSLELNKKISWRINGEKEKK